MLTMLCRFRANFPKTGGGEDIDFCLQIGKPPALVAVPDAAVHHPLWSGGRYQVTLIQHDCHARNFPKGLEAQS